MLLTLLTYSYAPRCDFVNFDDGDYVYANENVKQGLTHENLRWLTTAVVSGNWHPLTMLSLLLDRELHGDWPGGYHLSNVLLHAANVVLVFLFFVRATRSSHEETSEPRLFLCWGLAALFAVHPLHVESVLWISERKDVLSLFFGLLSLLAYEAYARRPRTATYALSLLAFTASLLSKPMLVTLPFVLLLLDYWPLRRALTFRVLGEKIPFLALTLACCIITLQTQDPTGQVSFTKTPLGQRLGTAFTGYAWYLAKTAWPTNLGPHYHYRSSTGELKLALPALALFSALTVLCVKYRVQRPYLLVGWLWFVGALVPVIGLVQVGAQWVADRYVYWPHLGLFLAVLWGLHEILPTTASTQRLFRVGFVLLVFGLAWLSYQQTKHWETPFTLWSQADRVDPDNPRAMESYAWELRNTTDTEERRQAIQRFRRVLELEPKAEKWYYYLGKLLCEDGQYSESEIWLKNSARAASNDWAKGWVLYYLGRCAERSGRRQDALQYLAQSAVLEPTDPELQTRLGELYQDIGEVELARSCFRRAGVEE
jgi:tetratricopeptide (TPR) repeat protein